MIKPTIIGASLLLLGTVSAQATNAQSCVSNYDASIDYFPEKFNTANDAASLFGIQYFNNYKLVTVNSLNATYALYQCGTPAPAAANLPNGTEIYSVPVSSAAVLSTTVVPYLEVLGVVPSVKMVEGGDFVTSGCFQKYLTSGAAAEVSATNATLEQQQLSQVQVQFGFSAGTSDPVQNTTVDSGETYETTILGRSSWLGYYSAFYNLEGLATSTLNTITTNYNNLVKAASQYATKPQVAWTVYNAPDQYNNNTASWMLYGGGYRAKLTTDAGAAIDLISAIKNADIWIDETYVITNLTDVLKAYGLTSVSSYKFANAVYREDGILTKSGGYDWFGTPLAMADALLEDMINVVNPSAPNATYQRHWFRNVAKNDAIHYVSDSDCTWDETKPRPDLASTVPSGTTFTLGSSSSSSSSAASTVSGLGLVSAMVTGLVAAWMAL
ncbi:hypothetical protein DM01DRAFT_1318768 [Hesseltinella vesiculosa]|uniref:Periplasmic binding protein-like II n=1 Tax=Hesseltinella vesiculosa TaxID=101127 RepID=A0A1X2GNZ5_9FUNG|nr:hypothetical protein DM01DRAFT_1318768 [Hesseltinella vesiculosa]